MNEGDADSLGDEVVPPRSSARAQLHALYAAFALLTRLPVPRHAAAPQTFARALVWFPLVGAVLGALQAACAELLAPHVAATLCAVALVALSAVLTAALHFDGLADLFDGLGGSRGDPARALAIMRDSRIGSFGALALCLTVIAKVAALEPLLSPVAWPALLCAPIAARAAAALLIALFPAARTQGLGHAFSQHARPHHALLAALLATALIAAASPTLLPAMAVSWLLAALLGLWISRRLNGLTGDAYGATIELCELAFLVVATLPLGS